MHREEIYIAVEVIEWF
jgi:hypothetical protein